jgi:hypothetical protein
VSLLCLTRERRRHWNSLQERKVQEFGERITNGLFTKMTARAVRDVLRRTQPATPDATQPAQP